jgi:hypothetical protein
MEIKVSITEELLDDMLHVCTRYIGRDVDRCDKVEAWVKETKGNHEGTLAVMKIMEEFKEKERKWRSQFKKGDVWKPKAWECKKKGQKWCEYEPYDDPACDGCIHCHHPYERK